jgi:predicted P-loop ATPase
MSKFDIDKVETYLKSKYIFRFNSIKEKPEYVEITNLKGHYKPIDRFTINTIKRELLRSEKIPVSVNALYEIIESDFCKKVNPIREYFENLPMYDGKEDYIQILADTIKLVSEHPEEERKTFNYLFKKWMASVVANVMDEYICRNHTCFVLTGEQGTYKTTWLENLCPKDLRNMYLYSGKINPNSKDVNSYIAETLFLNIDDQLSQLNRKDENDLKELITKNKVSYRRPYDKYISEYPHICSFMASVNGNDFLTDSTGNRRFLPFEVKSIDINLAQKLMKDNESQIYAQAKEISKKGFLFEGKNVEYYITGEDIAEINKRNEKFEFISYEQDVVSKYFIVPNAIYPENAFMSTGEIMDYAVMFAKGDKINLYRIGKALSKLGYTKSQKKINGNRISGWKVHKIDTTNEKKYEPNNYYETEKTY